LAGRAELAKLRNDLAPIATIRLLMSKDSTPWSLRLRKKFAVMHGPWISQARAQGPTATQAFTRRQFPPDSGFVGRLRLIQLQRFRYRLHGTCTVRAHCHSLTYIAAHLSANFFVSFFSRR
jgi:hypothetical protein